MTTMAFCRIFGYVILFGLVTNCILFLEYILHKHVIFWKKDIASVGLNPEIHDVFTISRKHNTGTCHFPNLDPYGPNVKQFIKVRKHHNCHHWKLTTYQEEFKIVVNKTAIKNYQTFSKCSYQPYIKTLGDENEKTFLRNKFLNFTDFINATDEFCLIVCFDKNDTIITRQHFAFVKRNETLIRLRQKSRSVTKDTNMTEKRPMDVVMIGLESTSRLNFVRHMNFTKSFMEEEMSTVELLGYNKAGLNTLPNIVPMLLGITLEEMNDTHGFFDQYPFIWKDFMKAGYVTFFGEDVSSFGIFAYRHKGFRWPPTDYYMRQFISELEKTNRNDTDILCSGNSLILQAVLDKLSDFISTYHDVPKFTFSFIVNPTHDNPNGLGIVDLPLIRTLKGLNTRGLLDNTVLIVFGDHGNRYGSIRNTYQGRLEENLPALYVSVPRWFRKEHGDLYENLNLNRNKLISNVDIYATLQDILELGKGYMSPRVTGKYGTSLLRAISTNRTCDDLKIPNQFCTCQVFFHVYSTESKIVRHISQWIVKVMNQILLDVTHICSQLTLNEISHAWRSVNSSNITENSTYVIQFSVLPSYAEFEITVRCFQEKFFLVGDILRTNKYRGESYCVASHRNFAVLERYCYCRKQTFVSAKLAHNVRIAH